MRLLLRGALALIWYRVLPNDAFLPMFSIVPYQNIIAQVDESLWEVSAASESDLISSIADSRALESELEDGTPSDSPLITRNFPNKALKENLGELQAEPRILSGLDRLRLIEEPYSQTVKVGGAHSSCFDNIGSQEQLASPPQDHSITQDTQLHLSLPISPPSNSDSGVGQSLSSVFLSLPPSIIITNKEDQDTNLEQLPSLDCLKEAEDREIELSSQETTTSLVPSAVTPSASSVDSILYSLPVGFTSPQKEEEVENEEQFEEYSDDMSAQAKIGIFNEMAAKNSPRPRVRAVDVSKMSQRSRGRCARCGKLVYFGESV